MRHVVDQCIAAGLVQPEVHVAVDGTLVRANASIHSLKPITPAPVESLDAYLARLEEEDRSFSDGGDEVQDDSSPSDLHPPDPGPNLSSPGSPSASSGRPPKKPGDFRGERFSNRTHRSITDPDARLDRKSSGQEAHLRYLIHHTVDTRSSVILRTQAKIITGTAEREAALEALLDIRREHPSLRIQSVSGDGGYADTETLDRLLKMDVVPLIPVRSLQKEALPGWRRAV
ncbi:transposase, partial [Hydrogenibacillus schlegelii]|uniref:transposase n=1 Tax=Hydrogenibacillus schlegelii TaxID=1484 RepID=UPI0034A0AD02